MRITITKYEIENTREFAELACDLVEGLRGNVTHIENNTIHIDGLDVMDMGTALKIIRPYLAK